MKKLESSLTNMVLVLVLVAFITGGLLAYVNHVTQVPIKIQADKTLADGIKNVMGGKDLTVVSNDTVKKTFEGKRVTFVIHNVSNNRGTNIGAAVESTS
jgi:electron transport complex protein RnfG